MCAMLTDTLDMLLLFLHDFSTMRKGMEKKGHTMYFFTKSIASGVNVTDNVRPRLTPTISNHIIMQITLTQICEIDKR